MLSLWECCPLNPLKGQRIRTNPTAGGRTAFQYLTPQRESAILISSWTGSLKHRSKSLPPGWVPAATWWPSPGPESARRAASRTSGGLKGSGRRCALSSCRSSWPTRRPAVNTGGARSRATRGCGMLKQTRVTGPWPASTRPVGSKQSSHRISILCGTFRPTLRIISCSIYLC